MSNRLHKSSTNRVIAGVCGGLGEYFGVDATFVRLLFVLLVIFHGIGILAYVVLWIVMPRETSTDLAPRDVVRENIGGIREEAQRLGDQLRGGPAGDPAVEGEIEGAVTPRSTANRQMLAGLVLLVLGVLFLFDNLGVFWWFRWGQMWPLVLIVIGAFLIYERSRPRA
jgi:phage shock protein PspC (stress-responsive transcriptional regulator)